MSPHKKVYFDYYGITEGDFWPCEYCGMPMVDVHAIKSDGMGGSPSKKTHVIENLMALCRKHHDQTEFRTGLSKEFLKEVHIYFMDNQIPYLLK